MRRAVALVTLAGLLGTVPPAGAAPLAAPCQLTGGFKTLGEMVPEVGECVEDARAEASTGNVLQKTTGGLLVWRRVGNWTAFTDGFHTWVNGPFGLQQRLSNERFDWEEALAPAPPAPPAPAPGSVGPGPAGSPAAALASCVSTNNDDPVRAAPLGDAVSGTIPPAVWSRSGDTPDRIAYRYYTFTGDGTSAAVAAEVVDDGGYRVRVNVYAPDGSLAGTILLAARERQQMFIGPTAPGQYLVQLTSYRPADVQFRLELRRG
jgi:hypothetical protein